MRLRHGKPIRVGLTGSLASGKSTVLKVFKKEGWSVLSADAVVAEIYQEKKITKDWILKKFGSSEAGMKRLEKWIHPLVKRKVLAFHKKAKRNSVVEVPLLFEAKFERCFDLTIAVFAPRSDRLRRVQRRGMSKKLFEFLDQRQIPAFEKNQRSDFVLVNLEKKQLKKQVKALSEFLKSLKLLSKTK